MEKVRIYSFLKHSKPWRKCEYIPLIIHVLNTPLIVTIFDILWFRVRIPLKTILYSTQIRADRQLVKYCGLCGVCGHFRLYVLSHKWMIERLISTNAYTISDLRLLPMTTVMCLLPCNFSQCGRLCCPTRARMRNY